MVGVVYPGTWGGQAVFLPGDTILQVPLPAVNQTLRSHWPVELHIGNGVLPLVPHSKNRDGAAQVVTPISPQLCGGTTRQLCPWCPLAAPLTASPWPGQLLCPTARPCLQGSCRYHSCSPPLQHIHVLKALKHEQKGGFSPNYKLSRVTLKGESYINF